MANYYPPVSFHFLVEVLGFTANRHDVRFTEVSGLAVDLETEECIEGGENRFVQKYPTRAKYQELVLKRGLLVDSEVTGWIRACIEDLAIAPKNVDIKLLNDEHQPLITWHLVNAYPTKWSVSDFNAASNTVSIETMQLFYQYFTVDRG
ncbi:phage tail protein [Desulfobulbus sp.]|uniref:phage tail protein n=1 Tax=Desulfobulbus sp. TaxID=895 RepID=UPI00286EF131|nr:phage tail protein [Desulfobulbus sp.]